MLRSKEGSKFKIEIYRKMFKKLLLKVYNATVSEITLQASSGSVDYEFAKTVKEGFKVQDRNL